MRQRCTAVGCLLNKKYHSVGSNPKPQNGSKVAALIQARESVELQYQNGLCIDDGHQFWCGNSVIRLQIREWTSIVLTEELILRTGDRLAIFNFRGLHSKVECNKMRDAIIAFRTYPCF